MLLLSLEETKPRSSHSVKHILYHAVDAQSWHMNLLTTARNRTVVQVEPWNSEGHKEDELTNAKVGSNIRKAAREEKNHHVKEKN